jgi:hypothetical protein
MEGIRTVRKLFAKQLSVLALCGFDPHTLRQFLGDIMSGRKTDKTAEAIVQTIYLDALSDETADPVKFYEQLMGVLKDNNIGFVNLDMFDEMSELCGPAMDELWDAYEEEDDDSR